MQACNEYASVQWVGKCEYGKLAREVVRGVAGELEDEKWRLGSTTLVRRVAGDWEDENWRLGSTTLVRRVAGEWEDENWRVGSGCELGFFSEIPYTRARCFSPYQQLTCSWRWAGLSPLGGLGGLRATSFISSDRSLLRDTSGAPASALLCPHSGSFFSVSFSWRRARCFSPYQQPKCSRRWAGLSPLGRRWGVWEAASHTQTPTHSLNLHEHTHTQTHFHTDIDTRTETHTLPQLTRLHTSHCTLTG